MPRLLALGAAVAFLVGCSGTTVTQSALIPQGALVQRSRPFTPLADCPAAQGSSGILTDGDFSQAADPGNQNLVVSKGQVFAPSWQVTQHTLDFLGSTYWNMDGLCSVDLDGYLAVGGIGHSGFATTTGAAYTVAFLLSGNPDCSPTVKTMKVVAAGQFTTFTWDVSNGNDVRHGKFATETWGFTAAGPITVLKFASLDPRRSGCGAVVAAISVTKN